METGTTAATKTTVKNGYPVVPLPVKIISIQLNENYHRDQDLFHLS